MVNRIVKIMGTAYSTGNNNVSVTVKYNGQQVFSGTVPTTKVAVLPAGQPVGNADSSLGELGTFQTTTAVTGNIPVQVSVTGGKIFFAHFWMNYIGARYDPVPTDPSVPVNLDNESTYQWVLRTNTESHFGDPNINTVESDGLTNTKINGQPFNWRVNVSQDQLGDWFYPVNEGEIFEFDFFVDPEKIQLTNE